jgi:hypothetical protein
MGTLKYHLNEKQFTSNPDNYMGITESGESYTNDDLVN